MKLNFVYSDDTVELVELKWAKDSWGEWNWCDIIDGPHGPIPFASSIALFINAVMEEEMDYPLRAVYMEKE